MVKLGRMELAALKRMEKSLKPLENKLNKLDSKLKTLFEERKKIAEQHEKMVEVMNTYTGGVPYETILYPETVIDENIQGEVDDSETVEMEQVVTEPETSEVEAETEASPSLVNLDNSNNTEAPENEGIEVWNSIFEETYS
jgi:chromosome segregation ATPase